MNRSAHCVTLLPALVQPSTVHGGDCRLSTVLFPEKPFNGLGELLGAFSTVELAEYDHGDTPEAEGFNSSTAEKEGSPAWHVANVIARLRGLVEVRT